MKKTTVDAIEKAFQKYRDTVADDLAKQSAEMFIAGDLKAQSLLTVSVDNVLVQEEALEYATEYGKLLKKDGASIINGKKITWLKDSTDKMRLDTITKITEGIDAGESMDDLTKELRKTFVTEHEYKLRMIARTETARIQNIGTVNRYKKLDITHVEVLDNEGPNSCEACGIANGQTWTVKYATSHELEHPNCVRNFSPIVPDDWEVPQ